MSIPTGLLAYETLVPTKGYIPSGLSLNAQIGSKEHPRKSTFSVTFSWGVGLALVTISAERDSSVSEIVQEIVSKDESVKAMLEQIRSEPSFLAYGKPARPSDNQPTGQ